jgi:hypothetical protein
MDNDHFVDPVRQLTIYTPRTLGNPQKCWYCGKQGATEGDHFYPRSLGGRLKVRSCIPCNRTKADLTPLEWIARIDQLLQACKGGQGCDAGTFIRSNCDAGCYQRKVLKRMRHATATLWNRVKQTVTTNDTKRQENY